MLQKCSVLILAAGDSSRMGKAKIFLDFPGSGTFLDKIIEQYLEFACEQIGIVVNKGTLSRIQQTNWDTNPKIKYFLNPFPERGRFSSIRIGLQRLDPVNAVFIHNSDNPYAENHVLSALKREIQPGHWVKPVYQSKGGHPVLLSKSIVNKLKTSDSPDIPLKKFLMDYPSKQVEVDSKHVLWNINSREDYDRFLRNEL